MEINRIDERKLSPAKRRILAALREHQYEPLTIGWQPMVGGDGNYEGGFDIDGWGSFYSADECVQWLDDPIAAGCLHEAQAIDGRPDDGVPCGFLRFHLMNGTVAPVQPGLREWCFDCAALSGAVAAAR